MDATPHHEGLVLLREDAGERHLRLTLLDPSHGLVRCLYKPAAKSGSPMVTPDLFDSAEVFLSPPKAGECARFVREYRLVRRLPGLGSDYARLTLACRLARLLAKNPHPPESWPVLHALACDALAAIASKPRPDAAYFKCLWRIARDEGWPVKEDFAERLRPGERALAALALATPLASLAPADAPPALIEGLTRDLERWLAREAHYVFA